MFLVLLLVLLGVPVAEVFFIIGVAGDLGIGETIGLLVGVSILGAVLVRRSGMGVMRQIRERLARGEVPGKELVDGLLILAGGLLMLTPGFLTDAVGLLLLVPPTRPALRALLIRRYGKRMRVAGWSPGTGRFGGFGGSAPGGSGPSGAAGDGHRRPGGYGSAPGQGHIREVREARGARRSRRRRTGSSKN